MFFGHILLRGKEYYKKCKVKGFTSSGDGCMARVLGTHIYNVRITHMDRDYPEMTCDCAYARGGDHCKHEAAVLFTYWNQTHREKEIDLSGFSLKSDKGNTYFNVGKILEDYNVDDDELFKAKELSESGNLILREARTMYVTSPMGEELALQVQGELSGNRTYPVSVRLLLGRERLLTADCFADHRNGGYYGYYAYEHLCEHKLALLLLADDYIAKYNPGDDTDYLGSRILGSYRKLAAIQKIDETVEKVRCVRLEPRLMMNSRNSAASLSVSFKLGIEKLYILKNIPELVTERESGSTHKLSKTSAISFMDCDFDDESLKYYEIMKKAKSDADYMSEKTNELRYYYSAKSLFQVKDKIELSREILDMLYDAALGKTIELHGSTRTSRVKVTDGKLKTRVIIRQLSDKTGGFKGLQVYAKLPMVMKGMTGDYILDEEKGTFSRIKEISPIVKTLMDSADGESQVSFTIGKKSLSEFYYRFLPELMDCPEVDVVEDEDAGYQKYLPPECAITYYLDADDEYITGKVTAKYEDQEISLHTLRDSDFPLSESRDTDFEQVAVKALLKYLPQTDANDDIFFCEKSADNTFELLSEGVKELIALGQVQTTKDFEKLRIRRTPPIRLGVSIESGILNLDVSTDDMTEEELLELLESYRKQKKFFRLRNGEFVKLEKDDALEELIATMQSMGISAKEFTKGKLHLPLFRAIYINKLLEEHDEIASDRDAHFKSLIRNFNSVKESDIEVPESLAGVLRGYQTYGFKWLGTLCDLGFGGILADDMGLGKTIQVIALILSRKELAAEDRKSTSLIVCPASLVYNWEEEFKRFAPSVKVKTVTGTQAERKKLLAAKKLPEVLITSYDLLKRDIGSYEDLSFDIEIIDEAQFIKNAQAAASKSVKVIRADHRFALTGTPIENRLSELWSIFDYLMPGFLYTYERFRSDYETAITKYKDEDVTKQLRNMVGPFILRRLKEDVLKDLPDKIEEVRFSRFDTSQRKLYDAQVTHMKKLLESGDFEDGKGRIKVLAELTKIRQICCDPELITAGYKGESAKRASCLELVQSAIDGGHKILLFSQFTSMFELLEKDLKESGIEFYKITGQTPKEERIKLVHAFNENEVPLFLISLKAGGTGLNLTGADVVIHYDPWWNLAAQNQATDRAHRIGQTKKVSVFKLIVKDTIEEKIVEMQNAKKDLADAILSGESESLMNMTREQLMDLLG